VATSAMLALDGKTMSSSSSYSDTSDVLQTVSGDQKDMDATDALIDSSTTATNDFSAMADISFAATSTVTTSVMNTTTEAARQIFNSELEIYFKFLISTIQNVNCSNKDVSFICIICSSALISLFLFP